MSLTSAMDDHLQRYESSDAGDDSDTHTPGGSADAEQTSFWVVLADTSPFRNNNVCMPVVSLNE